MSLLDDARLLADFDTCWICMDGPRQHLSDCPMRPMPQVVAALEAAERVSGLMHFTGLWCPFCLSTVSDEGPKGHRRDCDWLLLRKALDA